MTLAYSSRAAAAQTVPDVASERATVATVALGLAMATVTLVAVGLAFVRPRWER